MKTLIVPVDFSEESLNGLDMALMFSKKIPVNIQMVYVLHYSAHRTGASPNDEIRYANRKFDEIVEKYKEKLGDNSKLRFIVKKGKVHKEIVNQAHSYRDALIVASTHGATGFKEAFLGSNAYKIVSSTMLPVFTIRKGPAPGTINKIVLPITAQRTTRQKVPFTKDLALLFDAEVHIVLICSHKNKKGIDKVKAYSKQVKAYFGAAHVKYQVTERFGDSYSDEVTKYANEINADLITIMTDKTSRVSLLVGNFAHQILSKSDVPVVCITPKLIGFAGSFSTFGG